MPESDDAGHIQWPLELSDLASKALVSCQKIMQTKFVVLQMGMFIRRPNDTADVVGTCLGNGAIRRAALPFSTSR